MATFVIFADGAATLRECWSLVGGSPGQDVSAPYASVVGADGPRSGMLRHVPRVAELCAANMTGVHVDWMLEDVA